jgi:hypothetical protein
LFYLGEIRESIAHSNPTRGASVARTAHIYEKHGTQRTQRVNGHRKPLRLVEVEASEDSTSGDVAEAIAFLLVIVVSVVIVSWLASSRTAALILLP